MYDLDYLFKEFETKKTKKDLEKLRKEYEDTNPFFLSQLNQSLLLRPYQLEAISRLDYVIENDDVYFEDKSIKFLSLFPKTAIYLSFDSSNNSRLFSIHKSPA